MLILCVKKVDCSGWMGGWVGGWMDGNFEVALNDELGLEPG